MRVSKFNIAAAMFAIAFAVTPAAFAGDKGGGHGGGGHGHDSGDAQNVNVNANVAYAGGGSATANGGSATANGGAGGQGGAGGAGGAGGQGGAGGYANGGSATGGSATGGSVVNSNTNSADNSSSATGGSSSADNNGNNNGNNNSSSSNSQEQSQNQSINNSADTSSSNNSSQNVNVNTYDERDPVHTAYAAPLTSGEDTCMGSSSLGAQAVSFGVSLGTTWQDDNCQRLKNSRQLVALGYHRAATALMCVDDDVREAMEEAGTPCPSRNDAPAVVPVAAPAAPAVCPAENFLVHFEWDRSNLNREATEVIDNAVARARQCNVNGAVVIGHTDTSGSNAYNARLSERRSSVVRNALIERGISADMIRTEARGESDLARATGDGVREGLNRRTAVTISFR